MTDLHMIRALALVGALGIGAAGCATRAQTGAVAGAGVAALLVQHGLDVAVEVDGRQGAAVGQGEGFGTGGKRNQHNEAGQPAAAEEPW